MAHTPNDGARLWQASIRRIVRNTDNSTIDEPVTQLAEADLAASIMTGQTPGSAQDEDAEAGIYLIPLSAEQEAHLDQGGYLHLMLQRGPAITYHIEVETP